jgi:hypothetical protein
VATHLFQLSQNSFSGNFGNLLFLVVFHFRSRFEALNDVFWENGEKYLSPFYISPTMNPLNDTFPTGYHTPKTEIVCKIYDPGKLMY